jgi:hypothetical protein
MFGTLQGRLPKELSLCGIDDIDAANRYIRDICVPHHNDQFATTPQIADGAFVAVCDLASLADILCIERLQFPESRRAPTTSKPTSRCEYPDRTLAVTHGSRRLALQRSRRTARAAPDSRKRDIVLAAVKDAARRLRRWPTAILDGGEHGVTGPGQVVIKNRPLGQTKTLTKGMENIAPTAI